MKKATLIALSAIFSLSLSAQMRSNTPMFSIGVEGSLPVGTFADAYNFGFGGSAQGEFRPASELGLTVNLGYLYYKLKNSFGLGDGHMSLIPVMGGVKYYLSRGANIHGQLGAGFGNSKYDNLPGSSSSYTNFMYAAGLGYSLSKSIDAEIKYQGISNKGGGASGAVGLRLGYNF